MARRYNLLLSLFACFSLTLSCQEACYPIKDSISTTNATEADLILEGQCYTACLTKYKDLLRPEDYYRSSGSWYSVPYSSLSVRCDLLQKILECKNGCLLRSVNDTQFTDILCRDYCYDGCQSQCPTNYTCNYDNVNTTCIRRCRRSACRFGCEEYLTIGLTGKPPQPPSEVLLLSVNDVGLAVVKTPSGDPSNSSLTSFIIKLQDKYHTQYLWKPALIDIQLNLSWYSCHIVNVSYAAINSFGISAYSPVQSYCVPGESRYPQQIDRKTLTFHYTEDTRPDYLGHSIINISWAAPQGVEYLSHYELIITLITGTCGGSVKQITPVIINKNVTWYIYQATLPEDPPLFHCTYYTQLLAQPTDPTNSVPAHAIMKPKLNMPPPNMTVSCSGKIQQNNTIAISITWSLTNMTLSFIQHYLITLTSVVNQTTQQQLHSIQIPSQEDQYIYYEDLGYYSLYNRLSGCQYSVEVTPVKNNMFYWRAVPQPLSCTIDASLPLLPATVVQFINVSQYNSDILNVTWTPPTFTYGLIIIYEVNIGEYTQIVNGSQTSTVINITILYSCPHIKIRSYNGFKWSNWSMPLSLNFLQLSCLLPKPNSSVTYLVSSTINNSSTDMTTISMATATPTSIVLTTDTDTPLTIPSTYSSTSISATSIPSNSTLSNSTPSFSVIYILYGVISLLVLLIMLMLVPLIVICIKHQTNHLHKPVPDTPTTKPDDSTQPMKELTEDTSKDTNNRRAIDNVYSSITITRETQFSTPA